MHEQALLWIVFPYLETATPAKPLKMIILGKKYRGKTVKGEKVSTLFIKFKNCQISADG